MIRKVKFRDLVLFCLALALGLLMAARQSGGSVSAEAASAVPQAASAGVGKVLSFRSEVRGKSEHVLPGLEPGSLYSLLLAVDSPGRFAAEGTLRVTLRDAAREVTSKTLHLGDPDIYVAFRPTAAGAGKLMLEAAGKPGAAYRYELKVLRWNLPANAEVEIEAEPNNRWQEANSIRLGRTVFGTADDKPYIPLPGQGEKLAIEGGEDWFRFEFTEDKPRLVYFTLDLAERDNIPVDVSVYRVAGGELKPYEEGADPVTPPHEVQALTGNKFTTRVLREKGTYYARVTANHPFYQLRTSVYDVPPYSDPRQAVRAAVDYIISAGDSWHANTPRKGGIYDRVSNVHQETSLCVACHPTHFSLRAQLYSIRNGYPVHQRPQLQFLTERFYNNPRPFYGHPGAVWSRVISAPANVLGRITALINIYEHEVTGEHREKLFTGVGEYLKLYYKSRTKLPPDESNGNTPIISTYEVAWYSWVVLDELYRRTGGKSWLAQREHARELIEQTQHKNMLDLCYQTLALCTIDRERYRDRIRANAEKILSYQRPNGQWAMNFEADAPEAEFQTGHAVWTLAVAGYPADDPRVAKAVKYLLGRQQPFGGWFDPVQSYENFRTPFRETQMAVLALSELYKGPNYNGHGAKREEAGRAGQPAMGWGRAYPAAPARLDFSRPDRLLADLDNIWDPPAKPLLSDVLRAARHDDALMRQAAVACLGRVGDASAVGALKAALGDDSKMVQRTAAWALRQIAGRKGLGFDAIAAALADRNDRARWGATRVFATHFSFLSHRTELADRLLRAAADPVPTVRMQALKGLWQWWFWSDNQAVRGRIEDTLFARLAEREHPWVRRNLQEALYNIADDNIRYLYNNWVPLLGTKEDREQAIRGRLAVERRIAEKAARALRAGNDLQREGVLRGLTEFHLRNSDSYDRNQRQVRQGGTFYVRIGNDVETVQFFGESVEVVARALLPLLDSPDAETRRLATRAAFVLREVRMAQSYGSIPNSDVRDAVVLAGRYEDGRQLLARSLYRHLLDPEKPVRAMAGEVYRSFTLNADTERAEVAALLKELLASSGPEARLAALEGIRASGTALGEDSALAAQVKQYLLSAEGGALAAALGAVRAFPSLQRDAEVLARVEKALASSDLRGMRAAVELAVKAPALGQNLRINAFLERVFATRDSKKRRAIVDAANADRTLLEDRRVVSLLSESLVDPEVSLINAALGVVRQELALQKNPAILASLGELRVNPKVTPSTRYFADGIYHGQNPSDLSQARAEAVDPKTLDYGFFVSKVVPILDAPGRDGNACSQCHTTHAIFKLNPPPGEGRRSEAQLRENYRSALRVVDLLDVEKSLLLRKPTSTSESEGVVGSDRLSHGGGVRWGADSPEYHVILEWIQGGRLVSANR